MMENNYQTGNKRAEVMNLEVARLGRNVRRHKIAIAKWDIILLLLLIPFIQARSYSEMPAFIGMGYRIAAIGSSSIIYLSTIIKRQTQLFKKCGLFLLFWTLYLISTLLFNVGTLGYVIYQAYVHFALVLLIYREIRKNPRRLLKILTIIYSVLIFANFILRFLFPNGLYTIVSTSYHEAYLLGDGNAVAYVALPGIVISNLYSLYAHGKIKLLYWIEIVVVLYNFYLDWSATAIICGFVWLFFLICIIRGIKLPAYSYLVGFLIAILLVFVAPNIKFISNFIVEVLHKNLTFSGRSNIWASAFKMISDKPILGYGGFFQMGAFTNGVSLRLYPSHTTYLQLLIDGGVLLFSAFVLIFWKAFKNLNKFKNNALSTIIVSGLFCIMLHYIFEFCGLFHIFILLVLAWNIDIICNTGSKIDAGFRIKNKI